ncbi:MAG: 4-alpha-glucanotransferase [Bauldia sp.]|nr:4-alpha-glucanotransferase [Bauldia sp.]
MHHDSRIARLATLAGIEASYHDMSGTEIRTSPDSAEAVLTALGFDLSSETAVADALAQLEAREAALVPGVIVAEADRPTTVRLAFTTERTAHWRLADEAGAVSEGRADSAGGTIILPALPAGYHRLTVRHGDAAAEATVVSAPAQCWRPAGGGRWGLTAQTYALTSETDLGIGDFTDVGELAFAAGQRGADFLGLSPLHALFPADRSRISPYSPSSRFFIDPIYVDPRQAPGFGGKAAALLDAAEENGSLAAAKEGDLVDYAAVWAIKLPVLEALWAAFRRRKVNEEFDRFRAEGGKALEAHATFNALHDHFRQRGIGLHEWPADYRNPASKAVRGFKSEADDRIAFHAWLQWLADRQLAAAAERARAGGMEIGLYCDLAVGVDRLGSDVWAAPEDFGLGLAIGAPPDALAPQGQNWGLPPLHPVTLVDNGLRPFRAATASIMRHAGAIRIDHAFQLRRLFLIPEGKPAELGAYVSYPLDAMLAVLRIESHRARCLVIGEDLGTAPPGFAETLTRSGILSYRVLYFERRNGGEFIPPADYPPLALAVVNTHDLASFAGWWNGQDVTDRVRHGITPPAREAADRAARERDKKQLAALLARHGLLSSGSVPAVPPFEAVARLMARTRSDLVSFQIDDLVGATEAHNVPGVAFGAPNWQRRTPVPVEMLARAGGPLDELARSLATERRGRHSRSEPPVNPMKKAMTRKAAATDAGPAADATIPTGEGRVVIEAVSPEIDGGLTAVKRVVGDTIVVSADVFTDGHDKIAAAILYRRAADAAWSRAAMTAGEQDRWTGSFTVAENTRYVYTIEAWRDPYATWRDEVAKKRAAGHNVSLELIEGTHLFDHAEGTDPTTTNLLDGLRAELRSAEGNTETLWTLLSSPHAATLIGTTGERLNVSRYPRELDLVVDRKAALFSAWYELFPRSASGDPARHGTFDDVIRRLPYVRDLGFDVLYFPPIHPIGRTNRKGKNNSLRAGPGEPGSVYAIGAAEGGHDAIHPELGTIEDFRRLVEAAHAHGLEIALDFAINASLDHPWIRQHPEWFEWRPDGTLKYAENPPKKYEDISNVHFYGDALPGLWLALRDVILFWVDHGVKIFRVDNPHTKPLPFWEWLIRTVNATHPDVLFLAEAFTRPKMMKKLAKIGFQQSYTYFTWRDTKAELTEYSKELAGEMGEYYRPNFFVNTPDINPVFLQTSGRAGHVIRATLAATLSSAWGVYNGFEICEATPLPGREEYLDSEKYELRAFDFDRPGNIKDHIRALNRIRRENEALHDFRNVLFINAWNDKVIGYFRKAPDGKSGILVLVNLDPHAVQTTWFEVPLWEFGLADTASIDAEDLLLGISFQLNGKNHQITLDPADRSTIIWRLSLP